MGFHVRAEYVLKLFREPSSHNHISRHFFCTGAILAAGFDEYALQAVLLRWREIDRITSNRIRFLFFLQNDIVLSQWPDPPDFSNYGYRRYNSDLYASAAQSGFHVDVQRGRQVAWDGDETPWYPEDKVRRLAQHLGISQSLPCLIWLRHDVPDVLYVRPLPKLKDSEIINVIRKFSDQFYDDNVDVLAEIEAFESQIDDHCGEVDLTIQELRKITLLTEEIRSATSLLQEFGNARVGTPTDIFKDLEATCEPLKRLPLIETRPEISVLANDAAKWAARCAYLYDAVSRGSTFPVNFLHDVLVQSKLLTSELPEDAVQFEAPELHVRPTWLKMFLNASQDILTQVSTEGADKFVERISRVRMFAEKRFEGVPSDERDVITAGNLWRLSIDVSRAIPDPPFYLSEVIVALNSWVKSLFEEYLTAKALTIKLHIHDLLRHRIRLLVQQLYATGHAARKGQQRMLDWAPEVSSLLQQIQFAASRLSWNALKDYEQHQIPASALQETTTRDLIKSDHPYAAWDDLRTDLRVQFEPIERAMREFPMDVLHAIDRARTDSVLTHPVQILVSPGAVLGIASTFHQREEHMSNITVNIGDGAEFHGDFAVAERITSAFNKGAAYQATPEIGELVKLLAQQVAALPEAQASSADALQMAEDLDVFATEVTKKEPSRKWYEISAQGLLQAAQAVGAAGIPIIETVNKILELLKH